MPQDLINAKPAAAAVREFFGSSQLSQFMDQTNPLSEVTHKRRLSALGPGGLTRERAGFEVRDVHPTHYGRICPIETPEGPNIGLINSSRPSRGSTSTASSKRPIAGRARAGHRRGDLHVGHRGGAAHRGAGQRQARRCGKFMNEMVSTRQLGRIHAGAERACGLIDVSPKQLVSVAASLIPFLENDDANRALMGSNMMRQAVPTAALGGAACRHRHRGQVATRQRRLDHGAPGGRDRPGRCAADRGRATEDLDIGDPGVDIYRLRKFQRSNQNSCINQRPLVKVGDTVGKDEVIADGPCTDMGELALGQERDHRLHAVERLQLRGLDPDLRADRQG